MDQLTNMADRRDGMHACIFYFSNGQTDKYMEKEEEFNTTVIFQFHQRMSDKSICFRDEYSWQQWKDIVSVDKWRETRRQRFVLSSGWWPCLLLSFILLSREKSSPPNFSSTFGGRYLLEQAIFCYQVDFFLFWSSSEFILISMGMG